MIERQLLIFNLIIKHGFNWFTLASKDFQTDNV